MITFEEEEENIIDKMSFNNKNTKQFFRSTMTFRNPKDFSVGKNKL